MLISESKAFKLHLTYSLIDGIILGVLALNEFVFLKSLKGTNLQVGLLFQFSVLVLVFSVLLNELISRTANKKRLLRIIALITRLPLLLILFFPSDSKLFYESHFYHWMFLGIFFIYYSANPIIYPLINLSLRNAYNSENFGKFYSYSTTSNKIIMLSVTFLFGMLLDVNMNSYIYVFPIIGVLSIIGIFVLSLIPIPDVYVTEVKQSLKESIVSSFKKIKLTLSNNKKFKDFEVGFMFYGFAFMGTVGVIAIFFDRALDLNYSSVAFYKNSYNLVAIVILPFFGKLIGRIDPRKFSIITYLGLAFNLLFIGLTEFIPFHFMLGSLKIYPTLLIAMISYGLFAATMALLWNIGSAYFCQQSEVADYQAIHLTLTGMRSFFAPIIGIVFYEWFGFFVSFMIGFLLLTIAVLINFLSIKYERKLLKK